MQESVKAPWVVFDFLILTMYFVATFEAYLGVSFGHIPTQRGVL
jgi:hypothetical protein